MTDSYIGVPPKSGFINTAKQRVTSSTNNYVDLDHAISDLSDVIVWVNSIKQDSTNLSLTNPIKITLGGTLTASDVVEIVYLGKQVATQSPDTGSVTNSMLAGSIDLTSKVTGALPQANIGDQAINEAKLQVSNSPVNGYMLTAQSGNTGGLTWAEAPSGGLQHINTISITSSTASATFLHGTNNVVLNDGTYENFLIIGSGIQLTNDDDQIRVSFSVDNGSNYNAQIYRATDQVEMSQSQNSASASADGQSVGGASAIGGAVGNNAGNGFTFTMFLFNLNSTVVQKTALVEALEQQHNFIYKKRSSFITIAEYNQAIDGIRFNCNSGTFSKATFRLYGITNG